MKKIDIESLCKIHRDNNIMLQNLYQNGIIDFVNEEKQNLSEDLKFIENLKQVSIWSANINKILSSTTKSMKSIILKQCVSKQDKEFLDLCGDEKCNYLIHNKYRMELYRDVKCCMCKDDGYDDGSKMETYECHHVFHEKCFIDYVITNYLYKDRDPQWQPIECVVCEKFCIYVLPSQWQQAQKSIGNNIGNDNEQQLLNNRGNEYNNRDYNNTYTDYEKEHIGNIEHNTNNELKNIQRENYVEHNEEKKILLIDTENENYNIDDAQQQLNNKINYIDNKSGNQVNIQNKQLESFPDNASNQKQNTEIINATIKQEVHYALLHDDWSIIDKQGINELEHIEPYMVAQYQGKSWREIMMLLTYKRKNRLREQKSINIKYPPFVSTPTSTTYNMYQNIKFELDDLFEMRLFNYDRKDLYEIVPLEHDFRKYNATLFMDDKRWRQLVKVYRAPYSWLRKNVYMIINKQLELYFLSVLCQRNNNRALWNDSLYQRWKRSAIPYEYCWVYRGNKKISEESWNSLVMSQGLDWLAHPLAYRNTETMIYDNYGKRISIIDIIQSGRVYYRLQQIHYNHNSTNGVKFIKYDARDPSKWYNEIKTDYIGDVPELIRWRLYGKIDYRSFLKKEYEVFKSFCEHNADLDPSAYNNRKGIAWVTEYLEWEKELEQEVYIDCL